MRSSFFAGSAALLALASFVHAVPQFAASSSSQTSTATRVLVSQAAAATGTTACNNSPLLCNRSYRNITHMGAHNSASLRDSSTDFSTSGNTFYNATVALSAGIRLLQAQVHLENGVLHLCHSSCTLLDSGTLQAWLSAITVWMDANPDEVVTILLVNADDQTAASYGTVFAASGISAYGYTPSSTSAMSTWPTLQTMIAANTRLVTFITNMDYSTAYPYLLPEFTYVFETAFGVTSTDGFNCTLDRPSTQTSSAGAISAGFMGLINHFLDKDVGFGILIPDISNITNTNSPSTTNVAALGRQASDCNREWGEKPTFILTDFFNVGPAIATADLLNGITATGRTSLSTAQLTVTTSVASSGSGSSPFAIAGAIMAFVAIGNIVWL
ncbi:PLC-like phosphodiesterase [Amylocarpus encephaloides]|uniref:PLC-like phosphodiesterase n=1 Tax=Amylocarpus encephaloides TaxID=45428 RepID=A0A9P7YER4_9HELO|nr:PLC-like phosphodiesterase [Amylocarpus encephaloides]